MLQGDEGRGWRRRPDILNRSTAHIHTLVPGCTGDKGCERRSDRVCRGTRTSVPVPSVGGSRSVARTEGIELD